MKVYVVVEDYGCDMEFGTDIELFDTKEKALAYLKKRKEDTLKNYVYDTIEDEEESFSAYDNGEYRFSHTDIYIRERVVQ